MDRDVAPVELVHADAGFETLAHVIVLSDGSGRLIVRGTVAVDLGKVAVSSLYAKAEVDPVALGVLATRLVEVGSEVPEKLGKDSDLALAAKDEITACDDVEL